MSEKYTVYALRSLVDNRIYVGFTSDLERRLKEHNSGKTQSTKGCRPWKLFFTEEIAGTTADARKKEKYYKSGVGKEKLKILLGKHLKE